MTKFQKYPSTTILKHVNILSEANKPPRGCLHHMMPHVAYSITIHVHKMTVADISNKKGSKIPLIKQTKQ